jgi:transcriptional regulator with XRE-family HTH domain
MTSIPEQLRAVRLARHLSQKALGQRMGWPQGHVSAIENGKVDPRLSSLLEMARLLDQELVLVPRAVLPAVQAMLRGEEDESPLWQRDEPEGEGDQL